MNYEILVNKNNKLDRLFVPNDLVITDENENNFHQYIDSSLKPMIDRHVWQEFIKMQSYMAKEELFIIIDSGYRSYEYQDKVFNDNVKKNGIDHALKYVALPGTSEHQTGLAFDIALIKDGKYTDDVNENDREYIWLINNAYKYGFILRYPKDKEDITGYNFEPWHYRYVGRRLSTILNEYSLSLEEYYNQKLYYDELGRKLHK